MERNTDLNLSVHDQSSMTSSVRNNVSPMTQPDPSPSSSLHGIKRRFSQLSEAKCGPNSKRLDQTGESFLIDSEDLFRQLDQKQKECEKKDDQMGVYSDYINMLKSKCAEKDVLINRLKSEVSSKDKRLSQFNDQSSPRIIDELQDKIKQLKAEIAKKDTQLESNDSELQSMSDTIDSLQTQVDDKDAQLEEMKDKITEFGNKIVEQTTRLQSRRSKFKKLEKAHCNSEKQLSELKNSMIKLEAKSAEIDKRLRMKERTISDFRARCNDKDFQLAEQANLINQYRSKHVENEAEVQIIPEKLEYLEDKVNSHFKALYDRAEKCLNQKQYVKANVDYKEAIKFEKATQDRPDKLAVLFMSQSFCYGELKSYQQEIDAASSALQHDFDNKDALYNRSFGYFNLKQYSDAHQDLEKILQLDPNDADAQALLEKVQSCMNEAT